MIDLHAHLLPAVDDGPQDLDAALMLCRQAREDGISRVCACPHAFGSRHHCTPSRALVALAELKAALGRDGVDLEVAQGMECLLVPDLPRRIDAGEVLTLAGSRYLAVELPFEVLPVYCQKVLFQISLAGLTPVLVHPERNADIIRRPEHLRPLVEQGALVLVNAGSLTGDFGLRVRRTTEQLLRADLVHGIASDAHDVRSRPARLAPALKVATALLGEQAARRLVEELAGCVWEDRVYEA